MDVAPFGEFSYEAETDHTCTVVWEDPREIIRVMVEFDADRVPERLKLEYWQSVWPYSELPRDRMAGVGESGWQEVGDWYRGVWKTADALRSDVGASATFTFHPHTNEEFPQAEGQGAVYRNTTKVRVVAEGPLPPVVRFEAHTDSPLEQASIEVLWERPGTAGRFELHNGFVGQVAPMAGAAGGIRSGVRYSTPTHHNSFDDTVVTVVPDTPDLEPFSFRPADLVAHRYLFVPSRGALVRLAGEEISFEEARGACNRAVEKDLHTRVHASPEQTLVQAWNDMPPKKPIYIPLGFEGTRQFFRLGVQGNAWCTNHWLKKRPGKDTERCRWPGDTIEYCFGLPDVPPLARELADGCLPIITTAWEHRGVRYRQTAFALPFNGVPVKGAQLWADDPILLMMRIEVERLYGDEAEACLELSVRTGDREVALERHGDLLVVLEGGEPVPRILARSGDAFERVAFGGAHGRVMYRTHLTPESPSRQLDLVIPFVAFLSRTEWDMVRRLQFDVSVEEVREYWRSRLREGTVIRTPEPMLNDFHQAHAAHLLLNTEREVGLSGRYMARVGTFSYGVYANEACMMVSELDRRGYHRRARQALETWLHYQGQRGLPGAYAQTEGQFYAAGGYEDDNGYNQHHGWVLWCLAEHYRLTRDRAWLEHAAPKMVRACEWIIEERTQHAANTAGSALRRIERGLLPPGSLEDVGDWRCWLVNNIAAWWGLNHAAEVLAELEDIGSRYRTEARDFGKAILDAVRVATRRSPIVPLPDGSWIPHVPSEVHRRGRSFGWIAETLEGAIHLLSHGLLDSQDPLATPILQDFESNRYLSEQYGYALAGEEFDRYWFSRGGMSMQANLGRNPIAYLLRDEPKHYVRAFFNGFAASYFPDVRMMCEHALPNFGDWRGDHYKTSDEANSAYWLRLMFVFEDGDDLWLGRALPRYWLADGHSIGIERAATHFGPLSMSVVSHSATGRIVMRIDPPRRNPPERIIARFRHPDGRHFVRCTVNGEPWDHIEPEGECVYLPKTADPLEVVAHY